MKLLHPDTRTEVPCDALLTVVNAEQYNKLLTVNLESS